MRGSNDGFKKRVVVVLASGYKQKPNLMDWVREEKRWTVSVRT